MVDFIKITSNYSNVLFLDAQTDSTYEYRIIAKGENVQEVFDYILKLYEQGNCMFLADNEGFLEKLYIVGVEPETLTFTFSDENTGTLISFTAPDGNKYVGFKYEL